VFFSLFLLFGPLLLLNLITFLLLIHFNNLKCYRSTTWSSTNHIGTLIAIEQRTRIFLSVQEPAFVVFNGLSFWVLDPFCFEGGNFLISNLFLMIVSVSDAPRGGDQVLFGHQKQHSPPLGSSFFWTFKCSIIAQSTLTPFKKGFDTHCLFLPP